MTFCKSQRRIFLHFVYSLSAQATISLQNVSFNRIVFGHTRFCH